MMYNNIDVNQVKRNIMTQKLIFSSIFILLFSIETYSQSRSVDRMRDEFVPSKTTSNDRGVYNIKRMFLKSLGLLGQIDSRTSLFNFNSSEPITGLYREDKRLIKLFYSDSIKAGMNLAEVNKVLKSLDLEARYKEKL